MLLFESYILFQTTQKNKPQKQQEVYSEIGERNKVLVHQRNILELYRKVNFGPNEITQVFIDLMAPLGPLNPIYKEGNENDTKLINFLFGAYGAQLAISESDVIDLAKVPLILARGFSESKFFTVSRNDLNKLKDSFLADSETKTIGIWHSSIYRINDYFGDPKRKIYWQEESEGRYVTYSNIATDEAKLSQEHINLLQKNIEKIEGMKKMYISTLYKCNGKLILIFSGTSNNAFGLIYGASSSKEINCGVLKGRFRIIKDTKLDDQWRFWVAN